MSIIASAAMLTTMVAAAPSASAAAKKKPLTDCVSVRTGGSAGSTAVNSGEKSNGERRLLSKDGRYSVFASSSDLKGKEA